jgi:hypothetical protein
MSDSNAAAIAADSLGLHVLREIVDQFVQLPGFSSLTQAQQQVHIERLDGTVRRLIAESLGVIFSAEYPACAATLEKLRVGKSITLLIEVDRTAESRHELMDRAGQKVVVVMADPDRYYSRMTEVKARADQRDLFHDPGQPLGHMGVDEPPGKPPEPELGDSLDDAIPPEPTGDPIDMVTADAVWAALQAIGYRVEIMGDGLGLWSEAELHEAMVWALAARQFQADGKELPQVPEAIAGKFSLFLDEPSPRAAEEPKPPPEPVPTADDIVGITASLKGLGIKVTGKAVSRWSLSQRLAAVSWLAGKSQQRPEFIPEPTPPDSGADQA